MPKAGSSLSWVSLIYTLIVSQLGWFVKRIFQKFFEKVLLAIRSRTAPFPVLLTMIVYHRPLQKSIGNIAQFREKNRTEVCIKCELIFFEWCDIMEILLLTPGQEQPIISWLAPADNILLSSFAGLLPQSTHRNRKNRNCAF